MRTFICLFLLWIAAYIGYKFGIMQDNFSVAYWSIAVGIATTQDLAEIFKKL